MGTLDPSTEPEPNRSNTGSPVEDAGALVTARRHGLVSPRLDPLRDKGCRYAERLSAAGVTTELIQNPGAVHGFDLLGMSSQVTADAVAGDHGDSGRRPPRATSGGHTRLVLAVGAIQGTGYGR
ncbi:alpha/beta hydrolase fold domain-containing protein [Kitasatospora sp. NPDC008050]|uniref:alpha/beta hydrolase fold domain-containing protein n=1 Tax=Kitasatospora sp. NPDC008050 TaxID=3364021 RepID=UPI0036F08253